MGLLPTGMRPLRSTGHVLITATELTFDSGISKRFWNWALQLSPVPGGDPAVLTCGLNQIRLGNSIIGVTVLIATAKGRGPSPFVFGGGGIGPIGPKSSNTGLEYNDGFKIHGSSFAGGSGNSIGQSGGPSGIRISGGRSGRSAMGVVMGPNGLQ